MASKETDDQLDLRDVMLYAPIGFLYEYRKVLPQLVKKGRSQVQLGMFIGRMAASKGGAGAEKVTADALTTAATIAARGITELGQAVGLAPPDDDAPPIELTDPPPPPAPAKSSTTRSSANKASNKVSNKVSNKAAANKSAPKKASPRKAANRSAAASKAKNGSKGKATSLRLPIAGYDDLTAREVVSLLEDLTAAQRKRLRTHEEDNRNRKTILAKLDRLDP